MTSTDDATADERPGPAVGTVPESPDDEPDGFGAASSDVPVRHRRRVLRRVLLGVLLLVVVLLLAAGWVGFRGYQAARELLGVRDTVTELVGADLDSGSTERIAARLPQVQQSLGRARAATSDPVWRLAEHVPWAGDQLRAVRVVTGALDDVVRGALPAVGRIDTVLHAQEAPGTDGRLDLTSLVEAAPDVVAAAQAAAAARDAVDALDPTVLVGQLAGPVTQVQDGLRQAAAALDAGAQVATLLPPMLGADEPRTYLLVSLNSAELRSAGGIVGAFAVLRADDGSVDLVSQATTPDLPGLDEPILPMTDEELRLDTDRLGRWVQDAVMTPDFPRSAQLLAARWERDMGQHVDGVVATDPVAVRYLLEAIGPVAVDDQAGGTLELSADTVLPTLLHDAYLRFGDPAQADAFYTGVAATIFRAVGAGQGESRSVVDALTRAGAEGRLRVWSAHPSEQEQLAAASVGAAFLTGPFPDAAGVFLNDGTAGKLDFYLSTKVTVEDLRCDGPEPTARVRLDLAYDPPADVADYPMYVTGYNGTGLPVGWVATNITVYAPVGAPLDALRKDEGWVSGVTGTAAGRRAQVVTSWLAPGERASYAFDVPVRDGVVDVWTTPTTTQPGTVHAACATS